MAKKNTVRTILLSKYGHENQSNALICFVHKTGFNGTPKEALQDLWDAAKAADKNPLEYLANFGYGEPGDFIDEKSPDCSLITVGDWQIFEKPCMPILYVSNLYGVMQQGIDGDDELEMVT